jgi:adenylate cyclase
MRPLMRPLSSFPVVPHFLRDKVKVLAVPMLMSIGAAAFVYGLRSLSLLQGLELQLLDRMLQMRPSEPLDERIVIVSIDEADLSQAGAAVLSDQMMADLIRRVAAQNPRVIGLDLYRNLPLEPGSQELAIVLQNTPNLIGIEKVIADERFSAVKGHPVLTRSQRVAASDISADPDGRVRRGFLFPATQGDRILESLSLRVALDYLSVEKIQPDADSAILSLNRVQFPQFKQGDGSYVSVDDGGYQVLLNLRNPQRAFRRVSMTDVLQGKISPQLMADRIVFIGSTTVGDADVFFTSYSNTMGAMARPIYGVELHANLTSQIISGALNERPATLRSLAECWEASLLVVLAILCLILQLLDNRMPKSILIGGLMGVAIVGSYGALLWGWWLPVVPSLLVMLGASLSVGSYQNRQLKQLSSHDELTRIANRRRFNEVLQREWVWGVRSRRPLSLIVCDVDYFKRYNDIYGHPKGDVCLRAVAGALKASLKRSTDVVARYGGEEFVILLPNTDSAMAMAIAEAARQQVKALQIEHRGSDVSECISLSLGVTTLVPSFEQLANILVEVADAGLYQAKQEGRNRAVFRSIL